jgi:hypothetical protein
MDALMNRIGEHRVPITDEMMEVVEDPDVMGALAPAVRRGVQRTLAAVPEGETPYLSVRDWDVIRRELGRRARTENGRRYGQLRDRVRNYVGGAVEEYERGLQEFERRSETARGMVEGAQVLRRSTREFADRLQNSSTAARAGVRVNARTTLANLLRDPVKAERLMARLARDAGMRQRTRMALRDDEAAELEQLAARYGHQLDFSAGLRLGRSVLRQTDTEAFEEAVEQAGRVGQEGAARGTRSALTEAAGRRTTAESTAFRMAEDPDVHRRITRALGTGEQRRLANLGRSVTESQTRLREAAPGGASLAAARAKENAEGIQRVIQASVAAARPVGGGFLSNLANWIVQHTRLSKAAARRLAELATDPERAHMVIARLRRAGVESDAILRMYQEAAAAAGIQVGRAGDTPEPAEP